MQIQRVTIAKYETQKRIPSYEHLAVFAKFFNVSTDYLIGLTDVSSIELELKAVCDYTGLSEDAILSIKDTLLHADSMYGVSKEGYIRSINQLLTNDEFYHALHLLTLLKKEGNHERTDIIDRRAQSQ